MNSQPVEKRRGRAETVSRFLSGRYPSKCSRGIYCNQALRDNSATHHPRILKFRGAAVESFLQANSGGDPCAGKNPSGAGPARHRKQAPFRASPSRRPHRFPGFLNAVLQNRLRFSPVHDPIRTIPVHRNAERIHPPGKETCSFLRDLPASPRALPAGRRYASRYEF